jgi:hypothetical protein
MSTRPASIAARISLIALATLLYYRRDQPLSIEVAAPPRSPQPGDSSPESATNRAEPPSIDMARAVFDSRRLHNNIVYLG